MTKKISKVSLKKRTIRRIDPSDLGKARGGTYGVESQDYCVIQPESEGCPPPEMSDDGYCGWTVARGTERNHNQHLAR